MFEERGIKELLQKNLETSEESLKILRKMHRANILGRFFWILKWAVIIGLSFGVYYYIEPYLQAIMNNLSIISSGVNEVRNASDSISPNNISPDLLDKIKNLLKK